MLPALRMLAAVVMTATLPVLGPVAPASAQLADPGPEPADEIQQVVVISLDGLNPDALARLGETGTPELHGIMERGASTLDARSAYELTVTLPNHTSMVTGRRIARATGGHGVTWNDERLVPRTVHVSAGQRVESVFTSLDAAGLDSALFSTKAKFSLWQRSWPDALGRVELRPGRDRTIARLAARDLLYADRALTFVHLGGTDEVGHELRWMSRPYLKAVREADRLVGGVLAAIEEAGETDETLVVVTSDHGGDPGTRHHSNPALYADYRVPFLVSGPGVLAGTDLYALNPAYRDPGRKRPSYVAKLQPIRNGAVANLVTDVLGLPAVPGSQVNPSQDLDVLVP